MSLANECPNELRKLSIQDEQRATEMKRALLALLRTPISAEGYAFLVETTFRAVRAGLRIVELPITFVDRRGGQSKMSRKIIMESVLKPWRLRFRR